MSELQRKLDDVRRLLASESLAGLRLRGVDWWAWATCGGSSSVIMTNEIGVAEVLITERGAWVITNRVEHPRLRDEEIPSGFDTVVFAWQDTEAADRFVRETTSNGSVASDRPGGDEKPLSASMLALKRVMHPEEVERYRKIGRLAAEAMTEVMSRVEPTWTEQRLAGEGANACWSRGLEPTLCLVSGERRGKIHRHPIAKNEPLGSRAMLVFCARGYGLYANLTRFVYFSKPTGEEFDNWTRLQKVEAAVLDATRPGTTISSIYETLKSAYTTVGRAGEIENHHQGGPCGYLSREAIARPSSPSTEKVEAMMPFAWNPSLPGTKLEDTVLALASGAVEILTVDPKWPTLQVGSRARPDILIRA